MLGRDEPVVNAIDLFRGLRPQRITIVPRITGMRRTVLSWCVCQELTHRQHSKGVSPTRWTNSRSWSDTARTVRHEPIDPEAILANGGGVGTNSMKVGSVSVVMHTPRCAETVRRKHATACVSDRYKRSPSHPCGLVSILKTSDETV